MRFSSRFRHFFFTIIAGGLLLPLLLMSMVRVLFYLSIGGAATDGVPVWPAFIRGVWFDTVMACYVLIIPLTFYCVCTLFGWWRRWMGRAVNIWFIIFYALVLMACVANIPYFAYFGRTLNDSIWQWFAYPEQTAGMVAGEHSWLKFIALYFIIIVLYAYVLRCFRRKAEQYSVEGRPHGVRAWLMRSVVTLCIIGLCIFGIRGRTGYNPIKISAAYYCDDPTLNQLGLNPAFCLLQTTLDSMRPENRTLHLCDPKRAIADVRGWLQRNGTDTDAPLAVEVAGADSVRRQNVVIILMESMSADLLARHGGKGLTPFLDSLADQSLYFANCYSAGNHTNHGIVGTLYSRPAILKRNAMKGSDIPVMSGLPAVLRGAGWRTMFFMTHESQYDNMNAFLRTNGFEAIYAQEDYPRSERVNGFGVPDAYLFDYALKRLNEAAAQSDTPFFATLLTISNHPPYIIPDGMRCRSTLPEEQIVEYTDRCLRTFFKAAKRQAWYDNTLFVLLGDHGKQLGTSRYEVSESFNHIPLLFFGGGIGTGTRTDCCGQIDVAPTLLAHIGLPYRYEGFGIDLLHHRRPAIFYSADAVVCARDSNYLYIYNPEAGREFLYDVSTPAFRPLSAHNAATRFLKRYVFSNLQAAEAISSLKEERSN